MLQIIARLIAKKAKMDQLLNDDSLPDELPTVELGKGVTSEDASLFLERYNIVCKILSPIGSG